ncbi:MAG: hypothetical protein ACPHQQ_07920, partial [Candidatus Puniceispirillum sp.]
ALTGKPSADLYSSLPRSDNFIPPGLPVNIDTGPSGSSTGAVFTPEQEESSKAAPKVNDNIQQKWANLKV